jgi:hypothetical protein
MTIWCEAELSPSHGVAGTGEAVTSMARREASRYGDWAVEDAQSKLELLAQESSSHRRALDQPAACLAEKKGVARGDRQELLPTPSVQGGTWLEVAGAGVPELRPKHNDGAATAGAPAEEVAAAASSTTGGRGAPEERPDGGDG